MSALIQVLEKLPHGAFTGDVRKLLFVVSAMAGGC